MAIVFDHGTLVQEPNLVDWLTRWISGRRDLRGGPPEPFNPEARWWPTMTAREPLFVADKDRPAAVVAHNQASPRLLLRATLSPTRLPLPERIDRLEAEATRQTIERERARISEWFSRPLVRYQRAPWHRLTFRVVYHRHRGHHCWYDDALDAAGGHRLGCSYGSGEYDRVADLLTELAQAVGSTVEDLEII